MDEKEVKEKIKKLSEDRQRFVEQLSKLEQQVNIVKTNIVRLDGAMGFLNDELRILKESKEGKSKK